MAAIVGATVPDLRGEFIRGWSHDKVGTPDAGRMFGSWQDFQIQKHDHKIEAGSHGAGGGDANFVYLPPDHSGGWNPNPQSGIEIFTWYTGGNETRPHNIALLPCIKY